MQCRKPSLDRKMQKLFYEAYNNQAIYVTFSTNYQLMHVFRMLYNYKNYIRKYKLNPLYKEEWSILKRIAIKYPRAWETTLGLYKLSDIKFISRINSEEAYLPWKKLIFPKSTFN